MLGIGIVVVVTAIIFFGAIVLMARWRDRDNDEEV